MDLLNNLNKEDYIIEFGTIENWTKHQFDQLIQSGVIKNRSSHLPNPALLIIDMQDYFCNPISHAFIPSSPHILPNIMKLINAFEKLNLPILASRHSNEANDPNLMHVRWNNLLSKSNDLFHIIDPLESKMDFIFDKSSYDAFLNSKLMEIAQSENIQSFVIAGVATNLCVETTSRSAFSRGIMPIVPIDATATYNELLHVSSIIGMSYALQETKSTDSIIEIIKDGIKSKAD